MKLCGVREVGYSTNLYNTMIPIEKKNIAQDLFLITLSINKLLPTIRSIFICTLIWWNSYDFKIWFQQLNLQTASNSAISFKLLFKSFNENSDKFN